ncbi:MAG: hypothetical protein EXR77_20065 [Myxococcales bacterium]|nr:hypothetical protein [Myxococcales bacterium]
MTGNRFAGLSCVDAKSVLTAVGVLVDGTLPDDAAARATGAQSTGPALLTGSGIIGGFSAKIALHGVASIGNRSAGIAISTTDTATIVGALVRETTANPHGRGGSGGVFESCSGHPLLLASRLQTNQSAAVYTHLSNAKIDGCVLLDTHKASVPKVNASGQLTGEVAKFADGLAAFASAGVRLLRSVVLGNSRAGVLASSCSDFDVANSLVSGGYYGLVLDNTPKLLLAGAILKGTGFALVADVGLEVPAPPTLVKLSLE